MNTKENKRVREYFSKVEIVIKYIRKENRVLKFILDEYNSMIKNF